MNGFKDDGADGKATAMILDSLFSVFSRCWVRLKPQNYLGCPRSGVHYHDGAEKVDTIAGDSG